MAPVHLFFEFLVLGSCWQEKCAQLTLQLLNVVEHAPRRPAAAWPPPSKVGSVTELAVRSRPPAPPLPASSAPDSSRLVGTLAMPLISSTFAGMSGAVAHARLLNGRWGRKSSGDLVSCGGRRCCTPRLASRPSGLAVGGLAPSQGFWFQPEASQCVHVAE